MRKALFFTDLKKCKEEGFFISTTNKYYKYNS